MIRKTTLFTLGLIILPQFGFGATCSRINLTKCLDSACAINLSANPAARCQYCGTADAGEPAANAMKSISAGSSSKNTIPAKELKNAPSDPGERYVWATKQCLAIVNNCSTDDVAEAYDPLIEKSCTAAGISNKMAAAQKNAVKNTKTAASCTDEISVCITKPEKCDTDFSKCANDEQFDNFFAVCSSQSLGCTNFIDKARNEIANNRTSVTKSIASNIDSIVAAHKNARNQKITSIKSDCSNNNIYERCVKTACKDNTNDNCASDNSIASNLCEFYKTACKRIK